MRKDYVIPRLGLAYLTILLILMRFGEVTGEGPLLDIIFKSWGF